MRPAKICTTPHSAAAIFSSLSLLLLLPCNLLPCSFAGRGNIYSPILLSFTCSSTANVVSAKSVVEFWPLLEAKIFFPFLQGKDPPPHSDIAGICLSGGSMKVDQAPIHPFLDTMFYLPLPLPISTHASLQTSNISIFLDMEADAFNLLSCGPNFGLP